MVALTSGKSLPFPELLCDRECSWDPDLLYPYVTAVLFFGYYNCLT